MASTSTVWFEWTSCRAVSFLKTDASNSGLAQIPEQAQQVESRNVHKNSSSSSSSSIERGVPAEVVLAGYEDTVAFGISNLEADVATTGIINSGGVVSLHSLPHEADGLFRGVRRVELVRIRR